jgi:hypothetical protein
MRKYWSEKAKSHFYVGETRSGELEGLPVFTPEEAKMIQAWKPDEMALKKLFSFKLILAAHPKIDVKKKSYPPTKLNPSLISKNFRQILC